jgi:hypothetical protein
VSIRDIPTSPENRKPDIQHKADMALYWLRISECLINVCEGGVLIRTTVGPTNLIACLQFWDGPATATIGGARQRGQSHCAGQRLPTFSSESVVLPCAV